MLPVRLPRGKKPFWEGSVTISASGHRARRRLLLLVLATLVCTGAMAWAAQDDSQIVWQEARPLTWSDFLAKVPTDRASRECCSIDVKLEWTCAYELRRPSPRAPYSLRIPVEGLACVALMDPRMSWRDPECADDLNLSYMQILFDVYHVYAERLRMELLALDVEIASPDDVNVYLQGFARRIFDSCHLVIRQCERTTAFGTLPEDVAAWRGTIDGWMTAPGTAPLVEAHN